MTQDRKLLEPLSTLVSVVLRLLIGLLLASFVLSLFSSSAPFWESTDNCITADWISATPGTAGPVFNATGGAQVQAIPQYCADNPDAGQRVLTALGSLPSLLLLIGGLALLNGLLTSAAKDGVYRVETASKLRFLGWWLLIGSLITDLVRATAQAALLGTMTGDASFSAENVMQLTSLPYLAVLTALGLLTFARITRAGAAMREDLEGTV
ncbi:hypothetical protein ACFWTC_09725 [Streptomyces sp. NPDC058619]|uniref:hypothetical protein n=1 Tax=Streptomyces sp. NPDC058619 TaxID=3346559 RepID=UPI003654EF3D